MRSLATWRGRIRAGCAQPLALAAADVGRQLAHDACPWHGVSCSASPALPLFAAACVKIVCAPVRGIMYPSGAACCRRLPSPAVGVNKRCDGSMQEKPRVISRKRARAKPLSAPVPAVAGTSPGASKVRHQLLCCRDRLRSHRLHDFTSNLDSNVACCGLRTSPARLTQRCSFETRGAGSTCHAETKAHSVSAAGQLAAVTAGDSPVSGPARHASVATRGCGSWRCQL